MADDAIANLVKRRAPPRGRQRIDPPSPQPIVTSLVPIKLTENVIGLSLSAF
jgi:hypothetical protein